MASSSRSQDMQDSFLNALRREKVPVTIFLCSGVKLQGLIDGFDAFSLLLRRDGISQLLYKHSIATVLPSRSVSLRPREEGDDTAEASD